MWRSRRWGGRAAAAIAAALALAACVSVPPAREAPLDPGRFALFSEAQTLFAMRLTPAVRDAAGRLLPDSARPALDRAERVYGAVSAGGLFAAVEGRFTRASVRTALALAGGWKRVASDRWLAADGSLQATVPAPGILLVGTGDLAPMAAASAAGPADFAMPPAAAAALAGADAFGYIPAVAAGVARGLPVRSAWAAFRDEDGMLRGEITLLLAGESGGPLVALAARALVTQLLRDAGVADVGARLRDVRVQADAPLLRVQGLALTAGEIAAAVDALGRAGGLP